MQPPPPEREGVEKYHLRERVNIVPQLPNDGNIFKNFLDML